MANILKRETGVATTTGSVIYTVPLGKRVTIVGLRGSNKDAVDPHTFHIEVAGSLVMGKETLLPVGGALDAMVGSKIVAEAGDEIVAYADADLSVDIYVSYLEQTD